MLCVNARFLTQRTTGSQRYCTEIARRLRRLDPEIRFFAPPDIAHRDLADEIGVEVVGRKKGVAWEQIDLPRHLRRLGSPTLLSMQFTAPLRYPNSVVAIHDLVFLRREWVGTTFHYWYRFAIPRIAKRARRIVTVSDAAKREIVAKLAVPADKIDVVYGAVAPDFGQRADPALAARFGRYVLGVATLSERKNTARLAGAFRRVADPDLQLVLVGGTDPKIYGRHREVASLRDDPRIHLTGYVSDAELAGLYARAAVFVYPSLHEGFGFPPLEAMSLGCPVVASDTTSLPEVCGNAALLVDPRDEVAIAAAIERVLRDDSTRAELVARGTERLQRYDWERSAREWLAIARDRKIS